MDDSTRAKIENNLFREARRAVEPWEEFRWHSGRDGIDTYKKCSSQAIALDVFGTIKVSEDRDLILGSLAATLGLPAEGGWELHLEWCDPNNLLNEQRQTQIDAVARSPQALIFFESKFTELGGSCSQASKKICNGNYEMQTKLASSNTARCALTGKEIRYWEVIPKLFDYFADVDYRPCPFADSWYQWMRCLAVCWEVANAERLKAAFVVAYADGPGLAMAERIKAQDPELFPEVKDDAVVFGTVSFQDLVKRAASCVQEAGGNTRMWEELGRWIGRKIDSVCEKRNARQAGGPGAG
jgi:hypothetical protein